MNDTVCTYRGNRADAIVEFVYGEMAGSDREVFEAHLVSCDACRDEVASIQEIQGTLTAWEPPMPGALSQRAVPPGVVPPASNVVHVPASRWRRLHDVPTWVRAAAAMLAVGVGSGAANLDIRYGPSGLAVRTGWLSSAPPSATVPASQTTQAVAAEAWRADLAASEARLRAEFQRVADMPNSGGGPAVLGGAGRRMPGSTGLVAASERGGPAGQDALAQVRAIVAESERRQQRELALRVAEVFRDVQAQRQSDLVKIDRSLGLLSNSTGIEVARQRELINSLAVRVSQRQ